MDIKEIIKNVPERKIEVPYFFWQTRPSMQCTCGNCRIPCERQDYCKKPREDLTISDIFLNTLVKHIDIEKVTSPDGEIGFIFTAKK